MPRAIGPFPILDKYGDNTYKLDLPSESNITNTFKIGDLQPYQQDQELSSILSEEGGVEPCVPSTNKNIVAHGSAQPNINYILAHALAQPNIQDESTHKEEGYAYLAETYARNHKHHHPAHSTKTKAIKDHTKQMRAVDQQSRTVDQHSRAPSDYPSSLHNTWSRHLCTNDLDKGKNDILATGPSHQGPRTLLMILIAH